MWKMQLWNWKVNQNQEKNIFNIYNREKVNDAPNVESFRTNE